MDNHLLNEHLWVLGTIISTPIISGACFEVLEFSKGPWQVLNTLHVFLVGTEGLWVQVPMSSSEVRDG